MFEEKELVKGKKEVKNTIDEEQVTISKSRLDAFEEKMAMLEEVADKGRLANYQSKQGINKTKIVKLSTIDNKIITSWKSIKDEVFKINGVWREDQQIEVFYSDGTSEKITLSDFTRRTVKIKCEVKSSTNSVENNKTVTMLNVDFQGSDITIDVNFVN